MRLMYIYMYVVDNKCWAAWLLSSLIPILSSLILVLSVFILILGSLVLVLSSLVVSFRYFKLVVLYQSCMCKHVGGVHHCGGGPLEKS